MNEEEIKAKTLECLSCVTKPCQMGCPLNNDTTGFIKLAREGKYEKAYHLLLETTVLPSVCGRICPAVLPRRASLHPSGPRQGAARGGAHHRQRRRGRGSGPAAPRAGGDRPADALRLPPTGGRAGGR